MRYKVQSLVSRDQVSTRLRIIIPMPIIIQPGHPIILLSREPDIIINGDNKGIRVKSRLDPIAGSGYRGMKSNF